MPDFPEDPEQYHIEGPRGSDRSGALFGGVSGASMGQSFGTNAGLIAGSRNDPVLLAGVGYPLLGDLAVGTVVASQIAELDRSGVAVADCSHTPVAAYQTITDADYEAVLLVGAQKRGGELNDGQPSEHPGTIHEYDPDAVEVPEDRLVDLVGQAAMGLNTLENVVVVTKALGEFPERTRILAIEPEYDSWGMAVDEFTDPVEAALEAVLERTREFLDDTLDGADGSSSR